MNLRELMGKRAELLDEAQKLADLADKEARPFTSEERDRFEAILGKEDQPGELGALDAQITQITTDREKLRAAAEAQNPLTNSAIKPEAPQAPKVITRAEFEAMGAQTRAEFFRAGGKIQD